MGALLSTRAERGRLSNLPEAAALEGGFEELVDAAEDLASARVGRRGERRLHLAERLELAEELYVPERRRRP